MFLSVIIVKVIYHLQQKLMAQFPDDQCGEVVSKESLCVFCFTVALVYMTMLVCATMEKELQGDKLKDCGSKTSLWPVFVSESLEYTM